MLATIKVAAERLVDMLTLLNNSKLHEGDDGGGLPLPNLGKLAAQTETDLLTKIGEVAWGPDSLDGLGIDDFVLYVDLANLIASVLSLLLEEFGESDQTSALLAFHRTLCVQADAIAERLYHSTPPDSTISDES